MISRVIMHFLHLFGSVFKALLQDQILQRKEKETNKAHEGLCLYFLNKWGPQSFEPSNRGPLKGKLRTISIGAWDRCRLLRLSLLFLAPLPCSYCNALLCAMLSAVNCASSIWLTNIARLFQFECPDFHLIFCNVIFFIFFFVSSYPGISLEVFQVAAVFLLRHLLVWVVSTRKTRAPASTWVNIFLFFSLFCLLVFSFLPLSIFCNEHWFGWHRDRLDFLHSFICFPVIS